MPALLKISDAVSLAFHTMGVLAEHADACLSTKDIAEQLLVSEHHLQKVHQRLAKMGLIRAIRGPKGGFQLNKPAEKITLLEIYEAIDGPLTPSQCFLGRPKCSRENCILGQMNDQVNELVMNYFQKVTIDKLNSADLAKIIKKSMKNR
ncbi:MAG: Rrf2 family transcriptional regulator [Candidatus Omnitrophota bacterium]